MALAKEKRCLVCICAYALLTFSLSLFAASFSTERRPLHVLSTFEGKHLMRDDDDGEVDDGVAQGRLHGGG